MPWASSGHVTTYRPYANLCYPARRAEMFSTGANMLNRQKEDAASFFCPRSSDPAAIIAIMVATKESGIIHVSRLRRQEFKWLGQALVT